MVDPDTAKAFDGLMIATSYVFAAAGTLKGALRKLAPKGTTLCSGGSCVCFAAGTLVQTERGLVPIEEVRVGDRVWSRSDETGEEGYQRVARTFVTPDQPTLELELIRDGGVTERIEVTGEHPFWIVDRGWVAARELRPGDEVHTSQSGWVRVSSGTWTDRKATVYNLEVEKFHTYFVGEAGAWVHNTCRLSPSALEPTHPLTMGRNRMNALVQDIKVNGMQEPIKFVEHNGTRYVVDGHHRLAAAKRLGLKEVPAEEVALPYGGYKTAADLQYGR
jgi:hypothetical protein